MISSFSWFSVDRPRRNFRQELVVQFRCSMSNKEHRQRNSADLLLPVESRPNVHRRVSAFLGDQRRALLRVLDILGPRTVHTLRDIDHRFHNSSFGHGLYFSGTNLFPVGCWRLPMVVAVDPHVGVRSFSLVCCRPFRSNASFLDQPECSFSFTPYFSTSIDRRCAVLCKLCSSSVTRRSPVMFSFSCWGQSVSFRLFDSSDTFTLTSRWTEQQTNDVPSFDWCRPRNLIDCRQPTTRFSFIEHISLSL